MAGVLPKFLILNWNIILALVLLGVFAGFINDYIEFCKSNSVYVVKAGRSSCGMSSEKAHAQPVG